MHPVRAAAHGTEKLHAHLARRHAAGHRRHRLRPPDLALGRRRNAARPVARLDDARRRRSAGQQPQSHQGQENTADARIASPFYKKSSVRDHYNELELTMRGDYGLVVRLYDDGLAYRFTTRKRTASWSRTSRSPIPSRAIIRRTPLCRTQAAARFRRAVPQFVREHLHPSPADAARPRKLIFLPVLVELPGGRKMVITEADLQGYPGLFLNNSTEAPC